MAGEAGGNMIHIDAMTLLLLLALAALVGGVVGSGITARIMARDALCGWGVGGELVDKAGKIK